MKLKEFEEKLNKVLEFSRSLGFDATAYYVEFPLLYNSTLSFDISAYARLNVKFEAKLEIE